MTLNGLKPDYNPQTDKQLRVTLAIRGIVHKDLKLKAQLVAAVQESDRLKCEANAELVKLKQEATTAAVQECRLQISGEMLEKLQEVIKQDEERIREEEECVHNEERQV
jgi:hypothetical protein